MARQLKSTFTGTAGNLTFYKLYNQYYVRTRSSGGVQTEATKACQQPFDMASAIAAGIRTILQPAIPNPTSKQMQNHLVKAVLQWLRSEAFKNAQSSHNLTTVQGFQFVSQTPLEKRLPINMQAQFSPGNQLTLNLPRLIPKQHIIAPQGTKQVQLCIASGSISLAHNKIASAFSHIINVPYTSKTIPEQTIITPVSANPHHITATAVSISYQVKQPGSPALITVQQHQWRAASIIHICCH